MNRLLRAALARLIKSGNLTIVDAAGRSTRFGDGSGKAVVVEIVDRRTELQILVHSELALGEAYMEDRIRMRQGSLYDFLEVLMQQDPARSLPLLIGAGRARRYVTRRMNQWNLSFRARRNVAHHYDLDARLYDLFLDADRQYSCAYFEDPDATLEEAQLAKKRHIAAKLDLRAGQKVLDVGSGWGGLGLYLAERSECEVQGITLSQEQLALSRRRVAERGLADRVSFDLLDYRALRGRYDRIVSVGMFEHVGINHYRTYFQKARDLLAEDGVMLLHTIGRTSPPGSTNPWIAKYVFPGGYIPALSEILEAIQPTGLVVTDVEVLRLHYAETLRHWRERFLARRAEAAALYDERFCRMWEFYLAGSELSFRNDGMVVFQIQLARRADTLPLTRSYMAQAEDALRAADDSVGRSHAAE